MSPSPKSKQAKYRERLKENNPEKHEEILRKARERSKRNRDARKQRWESEPRTRALLQEIQDFKQKERKRACDHYAKKKQEKRPATRKTSNSLEASKPSSSQRPRDMTPVERREHNRKLKELSRKRETPKKKWWRLKKDREYHKEKRAEKKAKQNGPPLTQLQSAEFLCSPVKKSEYNLLSSIRRKLAKKTPSKFARLVKNLATNVKCRRKLHALGQEGLLSSVHKRHETLQTMRDKIAAVKNKFRNRRRKQRKDALSENDKQIVRNFFFREDISRALPHKRYATKHGAGFVMQQTLRQAHNLFKAENPTVKVGYTRFTLMRPRNVRKVASTFLDTCLCVYCLNIRLKVQALNRCVSSNGDPSLKVDNEQALYKMLLCDKGGAPFHRPECIQGSCQRCGDHKKTLENHYQPLMGSNPTISWSKWGRGSGAGKDLVEETGTAKQLVEELVAEVLQPVRHSSFVQHLFTAHWQHWQYRDLKEKLKPGQVILVMDFAENKKSACQDEIKSAHFNKVQFSFHPVVAFYRNQEGDLTRHALDFVSDDTLHDYHLVHHFTAQTIDYFKRQGILHHGCDVFVFSDNCAAQYKCKGNFADLSRYEEPVQRIYFGAEHGKGEADGETGVVSKAVETAVLCRQVNIRGAQDFFSWCETNLTKDSPLSKRHFIFAKSEDIRRERPETEVKTVTGSRKFHQVVRVAPMIIKSRALACFCDCCLTGKHDACTNTDYVGIFAIHQLERRNEPELEESQPEAPSQPPVPREEFFAALQQDLMRSRKSGFASFMACAQDCVHRARSYPLPIPVMEPEFERIQVDEHSERQRPVGTAPPDHFSRTTGADGNCLARALSAAALGTEDHHTELRVRLSCELATRKHTYLSPEYVSRGTAMDGVHLLALLHASGDFYGVPTLEMAFECEIMATVANSRDLGMWHLLAAANVLERKIFSIYPTLSEAFHRQCVPDEDCHVQIYIQWTTVREETIDMEWKPNHFVAVVKDRGFTGTDTSVRIGDFVHADFHSVDGKVETYRGVVVPTPEWMPISTQDVCVKCLRGKENGRYFVFPNVEDISSVPLNQVRKTVQPTINNRGHYFF